MMVFLIPDDFRAFMQRVVGFLDTPSPDRFLDAEDALQDETGYGGRVDGLETFKFAYITRDGLHKWLLVMQVSTIREIATGTMIEVLGERHDIATGKQRQSVGDPLLVWGEYGDDALSVKVEAEILTALDGLHASATEEPRMLRLWSAADDQLIAIVFRNECALYVVQAPDGYSTSCGEPTRTDSFDLLDHDGKPLTVPGIDLLPWELARNALLRFAERGELGPEIKTEGRIPSVLLWLGDIDRKTVLAQRGKPPRRFERSSLPRLITPPIPTPIVDEPTTPHEFPEASTNESMAMKTEELSAWARRLIELLDSRALIELGQANNLDEISYQLGGLLQAHGNEAQHSLDTAEWLANEIGAVRGVDKLFATGGDLQVALRRSRN